MARDFDAELRREDEVRRAEGIPDGIRQAIWARLERDVTRDGRTRRSVRAAGLSFAGVAAALALGVAVVSLRAPAARLGELQVLRRTEDLVARESAGLVEIERGTAVLSDPVNGTTMENAGPVALRREGGGVRIVRGRVDVTVAHRAAGAPPAIVFVSHGAIEVMGTAFTIVQGASSGRVILREGHIQFRGNAGTPIRLRPGEELVWPVPVASTSTSPAEPAAASNEPTPPREAAPGAGGPGARPPSGAAPGPVRAARRPAAGARSLDELLEHVEELRSRHQFNTAARELRAAIPSQPAPLRERLSFELGSLLTHQIGDARRACAQWRWHERLFPGGIYRDEVARARRALACPGGPAGP